MSKTPPTKRQLEVLQWIADDCPDGVMNDTTYKASAHALDNRNLVRVTRRRNPWTAEVTEAGRRALASSSSTPDFPSNPHKPASHTELSDLMRATPSPAVKPLPTKAQPKLPAEPVRSVTRQMMDKLLLDHEIVFEPSDDAKYKSRVAVARRKNLVPEEMELVITTGWGIKPGKVELKRRPEWQLVTLAPIDVPSLIRAPHGVVTKLKLRVDRVGMDTPRWNWMLRIVQGLAVEVERRGYTVKAMPVPAPDRRGFTYDDWRTGHVKVSIGEDEFQLRFNQMEKRVPHVLSTYERGRQERGYPVKTEDVSKAEFIHIRLIGLEPAFWQSEWAETHEAKADTMLPRVLQEMELRAARAEDRRIEKQRREDEARNQWTRAREAAIERLNENHRSHVLLDQAERFQSVRALRTYLIALKDRVASLEPEKGAAAQEWIAWAEAHAQAIDPLSGELRMPDDPEPTADAIRPYMNGWSPYGPSRGMWG